MHRFPQAVVLHQSGRNAEARALCVAIRKANPRNPMVLALQGASCAALGLRDEAIECLGKALRIDDTHAPTHYMLGNLLRESGQYQQAATRYRQALNRKPDFVEAWINLALVHQETGAVELAVQCYRRALTLRPSEPLALYNLGNALQQLSQYDEAIVSYEQALSVMPNHFNTRFNLANALLAGARPQMALDQYRYALQLDQNHAPLLTNMGVALRRVGLYAEARTVLHRSLEINKGNVLTLLTLANVYQDIGDMPTAVALLRSAAQLAPDNIDVFFNLGNVLVAAKQPESALAAFEYCYEREQDNITYLGTLAGTQAALWMAQELEVSLQKLLRQWGEGQLVPVDIVMEHSDDPLMHRQCIARQAKKLLSLITLSPDPIEFERRNGSRYRIGYLSPDFGNHPVGLSIVEILERSDRTRFEVIGLSLIRHPDSTVLSRLKSACDQFHEVGELDAARCIQFIRDLHLDLLIDLAGHTNDARPVYLAARLAPVQAGYLGFAGTLGEPWLDYLIADHYVIPDEQSQHYIEKIAWLPDSFFPSDTTGDLDLACSRQSEGLPEDAIVFCCFNAAKRITPAMMRIWCGILAQVDGSVLWLQKQHDLAAERMRTMVKEHGVDPERLIFARFVEDRREHLARHRLADLYLDTFPYNSHSTARDALFAGLPLLTCSGRSYASRVAGSLLTALKLPELITNNLDEYLRLAIALGQAPDTLQLLRTRLVQQVSQSALFDSRRLARNLEELYGIMIERARAELPAMHIDLRFEPALYDPEIGGKVTAQSIAEVS
jgi:predicted O-linked N-acetylglucosamine transferase (SPINDLY family)